MRQQETAQQKGLATFLAELRRRRVYRVAAVCATVAFVVLQAADLIFRAILLET